MLDDYDRDDLTDAQKDRRAGLQMGIAVLADAGGALAGTLSLGTGPGAIAVGGVSAVGLSAGLNAGVDAVIDGDPFLERTFGDSL